MELNHWSERLAKEVIERKREPYVITAGMTTSGPAHLGTVCEFLFPNAIYTILKNKGKEVEFYFIADIMDAFDSIPAEMKKYEEELKPHLGKPLADVPDPTGKAESFGEHYFQEALAIMEKMNVKPNIQRANELYGSGAFDKYARIYLDNETKVREIVERTSGRQLPKDWSPIMPICEKCGRIATTRVISVRKLEDGDYEYEYVCDKDVGYAKGCGHKGKARISDHKYKLQWRLHWPAWQQYFKTSIEGGGVDHFTKGGSWDTAKAIHREIFNAEPPIGYKYGFVLMGGKKFSKSKGIGMSMKEMLALVPAVVIKYHLLKYDLTENIDFVPTRENILRIIEDYENASTLVNKPREELTKAEKKKLAAYLLAGQKPWKAAFRDVLLYYQIYRDWEKVKNFFSEDDIKEIKPYIEEWVKKNFVPEVYDFYYNPKRAEGLLKEFFQQLKEDMSDVEIHNFIYSFARSHNVEPKEFFRQIYQLLIGKDRGPRAGRFIKTLGVERVKKDVLGG